MPKSRLPGAAESVGGAVVTTSVAVTVAGAVTPLALSVSVQLWFPTAAAPVFTDAVRVAGVGSVPVTVNHAQSDPGVTVNARPELGLVLLTEMLLDAGTAPPMVYVPNGSVVGLTVSVGGIGAFTVKDTAPLVPPGVVTVTLAAPSAAEFCIVNVAEICVVLLTVQPLGVMPALATATVQGEAKLVPVNVTGTLMDPEGWAALDGLMALSVGRAGAMVPLKGADAVCGKTALSATVTE